MSDNLISTGVIEPGDSVDVEYPYIIMDDALEHGELLNLWRELDSVKWEGNSVLLSENWNSKNKYPFSTYKLSEIFISLAVKAEKEGLWFWRYFFRSSKVSIFGEKYSRDEEYEEEKKLNSKITAILILSKERLIGGQLMLENLNRIDPKNNRLVLFPSVISNQWIRVQNSAERFSLRFVFE